MTNHAPSRLAVYPSLTAEHIKGIAGASNSYRNSDKSIVSHAWATDTLFVSQFGKNMFTHAVITWQDDLGRTILGLDTQGLTEHGYSVKDASEPTEEEILQACSRIGAFIQDVMTEQFGRYVEVETLAPVNC